MLNKIFLIGFMGVGKTSVGRLLAKKLGCTFYDTDDVEHWESNFSVMGRFSEYDQTSLFWNDREKFHEFPHNSWPE